MTEELYTAVKNDFIAAPAMPAPYCFALGFFGGGFLPRWRSGKHAPVTAVLKWV
jgi:hypothetical protein